MNYPISKRKRSQPDVVIIGAGLAGLSLARQLLLTTDRTVLVVDKKPQLPGSRQKVGESLVQVGGYYFAKVLDMEEHMLHEHFMKYNLRFYFPTSETDNQNIEDYGQSYIRNFSNIPCYQLDRLTFESELIRLNQQSSRFELITSISDLNIQLAENEHHHVDFRHGGKPWRIRAPWVIDTTGRHRTLARKLDLKQTSPIRHGSAFLWVDGLVDIEKLTSQSLQQARRNPHRRSTGHLPFWLATNHFMFEGGWLWVIPLRGKTSIGVVYDQNVMDHRSVSSPEKLIEWIVEQFPLFGHTLPQRDIIDFSAIRDFAYDCQETISANGWAMTGESARFHDPLYSPGSDFIAIHNTLIVDAIQTESPRERKRKCWLYEALAKALYNSLIPTYISSYDALGDQEVFSLKYTWELSVYFAFFVYPFSSDLFLSTEFVPAYLGRFSRLGPINHSLHQVLSDYYQWRKSQNRMLRSPVFHDFTSLKPLREAEKTFYRVGDTPSDAKQSLDRQIENLEELARFIAAHIYATVLDEPSVVNNAKLIGSLDLKQLKFDPEQMQRQWAEHRHSTQEYLWDLDPAALDHFRTSTPAAWQQAQTRTAVSMVKQESPR